MKSYIRKMETARRLAEKIGDLEHGREVERAEELRRPVEAKDIGYGGEVYGSEAERKAMIADGCHPDSFDCDGADRDC